VSKRLVLPILALALVAAACSEPPVGEVEFGSGKQFVPEVADSIDNVGIGAAVALDADGVPYVSYWGFPAVLKKGEIAVGRPIGAPFVPGVLLASEQEGVWHRGAAAMYQDAPARVTVPFGPATVPTLEAAGPTSTNGTDVAVGADGSVHVVWTAPDGIWYASGPEPFSAEQVVQQLPSLSTAGPIGWPSVALDEGGAPWVAATVATPIGQQVIAATPSGDGWDVQTVAELEPCAGCPQPARTGIAVTPDGPVVVYADPASGAVMAARRDGRRWTTETVDNGADGVGISVAAGSDGSIVAAYYAGKEGVTVATSDGAGSWTTVDAATVGAPEPSPTPTSTASATPAPAAPTAPEDERGTGVAVTDDGTVYLTYVDPASGVVRAAAAEGGEFQPIETRSTDGGRWPDVAATPDGATVALTWYAPDQEDLAFASYVDAGSIPIAKPSPSLVLSSEAGGGAECSADTAAPVTDITLVAPSGAAGTGFDTSCIVAPAGEKLTLTFDNQDPGGAHNAHFLTAAGGDELFTSGPITPGPETQGPETEDPVDEGTYYFQCDAHPDTMNGTFLVVKAPKK
jgi:plastocyanin